MFLFAKGSANSRDVHPQGGSTRSPPGVTNTPYQAAPRSKVITFQGRQYSIVGDFKMTPVPKPPPAQSTQPADRARQGRPRRRDPALANSPQPKPGVVVSIPQPAVRQRGLQSAPLGAAGAGHGVPVSATPRHWSASLYDPKAGFRAALFTAEPESPIYDEPLQMKNALTSVLSFINNGTLLPQRFVDGTVPKLVHASTNYTLGTISDDETLYFFAPTLNAYNGAILASIPATGNKLDDVTILAVVTPDIDLGLLGPLINVNGVSLSLSIQQSTGPNSAVAAFSNLFEAGVVPVLPLSARPGKMSFLTSPLEPVGHGMITNQTVVVTDLTATVPTHLVRPSRSFALQGPNTRIPSLSAPLFSGADIHASDVFVVHARASTDPTAHSQGGFYYPLDAQPTGNATMWDYSAHISSLRHIITGEWSLEIRGVRFTGPTGDVGILRITVIFMDGTTDVIERNLSNAPAYDQSFDFVISYAGYGTPTANAGRPLRNIRISSFNLAPQNSCIFTATSTIRLVCQEVNAATRYTAIAVTGAKTGQTLALGLLTSAEVRVDRTGDVGRYISPQFNQNWVDPDSMAFIVQLLTTKRGANLSLVTKRGEQGTDWGASPAGDHILTTIKALAKHLPGFAGTVTDIIAPGRGKSVQKIGKEVLSLFGAAPLHAESDAHARIKSHPTDENTHPRSNFLAAPLSALPSRRERSSFTFPLIDIARGEATTAEVRLGSGPGCPDFLNGLQPRLHAYPGDFTGPSCGFAFLLAYLSALNWPIMPGLFSGAVDDFRISRNACSFILTPVGLTDEKIRTYPAALSALTPNGYYERGALIKLDDSVAWFFVDHDVRDLTPPGKSPTHTYRVMLTKRDIRTPL